MVRIIDPVKMHEHSNASAGYPYAMFRLHNRGLLIPFHPLLQATVETVHPMRRCTVVRLILRTFDPHIYNEPDHLNGGGEEVRSMLVCGGGGGGRGCEEQGGARQVQRTPARQHGSTSARQHVSTSAVTGWTVLLVRRRQHVSQTPYHEKGIATVHPICERTRMHVCTIHRRSG